MLQVYRFCRGRPGWLGVVPAVLALTLGGCGGDKNSPSPDQVQDFITSVVTASGNIQATRQSGSPPAQGSGPTVTISGLASVINGGSAQVTVDGSGTFNTVVLYINGATGYYVLTLPSPTNTVNLLLTLSQNLPANSFNIVYGAGTGTNGLGTYASTPVSVIGVGAGEVQVSVSWNALSDVDLHVVEPGGEEVYYGNTPSATGGDLDLDSNAACSIDGKNNENITWTSAPSGSYTVRVDYWDSCGVASTDYVVTVQRKGQAAQTFTGSFTGVGDKGGQGSGTTVTTFSY
ncbi:MAG: YfaP family protein [Gemmatimonadales bacterium]